MAVETFRAGIDLNLRRNVAPNWLAYQNEFDYIRAKAEETDDPEAKAGSLT